MVPCRVVRADFLEADAIPCLRRMISASGKLPLASTKAFLHSIIPAPVRSRSSFTSFALISMIRGPGYTLFVGLGRAGGLFGRFRGRPLARQGHIRQILKRETFRHK